MKCMHIFVQEPNLNMPFFPTIGLYKGRGNLSVFIQTLFTLELSGRVQEINYNKSTSCIGICKHMEQNI